MLQITNLTARIGQDIAGRFAGSDVRLGAVPRPAGAGGQAFAAGQAEMHTEIGPPGERCQIARRLPPGRMPSSADSSPGTTLPSPWGTLGTAAWNEYDLEPIRML